MATPKVRTDTQGRQITQTAYDSQIKAGTDVSKYTKVAATTPITTTSVTTPTAVTTAPVTTTTPIATQTTPVETVSNTLDLGDGKTISKEGASYKALIGKGYTDQSIVDYYNKVKPTTQTTTPTVTEKTTTPTTTTQEQPTQTNKETITTTPTIDGGTTTSKETTTPLAPLALSEYQDNSQERQNQIVDNLNKYRQDAPQYMSSLDTFRKTFSYGLRSNEQKELLDNWYMGYTKGLSYSNMTNENLLSMYSNGSITDSDLELLRLQDTNKYNSVKSLIDKKGQLTTYANELYGEDTKPLISQTNPLGDVDTNTDFFDEYKKVVDGDEAKGLSTQINDKQGEIDQLQLEMIKIKNDTEKEYEGTGATSSKISAIVADRQTDIQNKLTKLSIEGNTLTNKYNSLVNTAKEVMQSNIEKQNYINTQRNQKMQELGFYYQYTPQGMSEMATSKYNAENPDMDSTDINTSKRALNQTLAGYYKDFGDIIQRPQAQVMNDIMKYAKDKGISVSQALKENFITPLQGKAEYKAKIKKDYGMESEQSIIDIGGVSYIQTKDANGNLNLKLLSSTPGMSNVTPQSGTGMAGAGLRNNNPGNIKDTTFGNAIGTDTKGFATFATPEDGFDALVEKIKYNQTNSKSAYYGKTIAEYIAKYAPSSDGNNPIKYAQSVANALGVNVNTKVSAVDATKFAAAIAKHDSGYDFSTYGKFRGTTSTGNIPLTSQSPYAPLYSEYINNKGKIPSAAILKSIGMTADQFIKNASSYKFQSQATSEQQEQTQEIYTKLLEIEKDNGLESAVGAKGLSSLFGFKGEPIAGSAAASFKIKLDNFINTLVLPNLGKLKGPMSDKDIAFLKSTAASLNTDMSEESFKLELSKMKSKLEEKLGLSLSTIQTTPTTKYTFGVSTNNVSSTINKLLGL